MLSTIRRCGGWRELFYFFGETIHGAASARWSASAVGMLGVVLPGGLGMGVEGGSSVVGWETNEKGGGWLVLPQGQGLLSGGTGWLRRRRLVGHRSGRSRNMAPCRWLRSGGLGVASVKSTSPSTKSAW